MNSLHDTAQRWLAQGLPAMLVTVQATRGSVPRETGTRMLVAADAVAGTIGGGHLEWQAMAHARTLLAGVGAPAAPQLTHYPLGPALGQCCGGAVTLLTQPLTAAQLADWPLAAPLFHLQLHGAGHVGAAIARQLAALDCLVDWIDCREPAALLGDWPASAQAGLPPHIHARVDDDPAGAVADAPPGAFYLVLTHRHDLDQAITEAILRRGDAGFVGLIGSATKRARFEHRLRDKGFSEGALSRLVCPIGVPGIRGKAPAVIAVSAMAQLLQRAEAAAAAAASARAAAQLCASFSSAAVSSTRNV